MNGGPETIFVVDDDAAVRKSLGRWLKAVGYSVEVFASSAEFLQRDPFDGVGCLVLDVEMPGLNGLALQAELARQPAGLPIVFITGHGDIPMSVRAMKAGAVDFITKPFDEGALLTAIENSLRKSRREREERAEAAEIQARIATLTPREREVLCHVASGQLNKQIASDLGAAEKTIKVHRARVMEKMRADSLADLVRLFEKSGLRSERPPDGGACP